MPSAGKLLEKLEGELRRFAEEARETAKVAAQVRELVGALREANARWRQLESRVEDALKQLERLEKRASVKLEQLEEFKSNAISDIKKILDGLQRELREAITDEKAKLAEAQNVIFKELQKNSDRLDEETEKIRKEILKAVGVAEASKKQAEQALLLSKWAVSLAVLAVGSVLWMWFQWAVVRAP